MFTAAGWRGEIKKKAGCRIGKVYFGPSVLKLVLFLKDKRFRNIRSFQPLCMYRTFDVCEVASQSF